MVKFWSKEFFTKSTSTNFAYSFSVIYPTPASLSYYFNFGFISMVFLMIQIATGIFLSMYYDPNMDDAFASVEYIMRDVENGSLIRYAHSNGASFFFLSVYLHMLKSLYFGSYGAPRHALWFSGVIIYILMVATAFLGYVLPWGQMSYWAATVITNLFTVIPYFGGDLVIWLWGGYSVSGPTLHRFFSLHYLLPFVLLAVVVLHLITLHRVGSNSPLGNTAKSDSFAFTPFFMIKDLNFFFIIWIAFISFVCFWPNYLGHPDNYIEANPLTTPNHIVPEWYFLPLYAILRAFPGKYLGIFVLIAYILILFTLPYIIGSIKRASGGQKLRQTCFWIFTLTNISLGYLGGQPVESAYYDFSQILSVFYFAYFLIFLPFIAIFEDFGAALLEHLFLERGTPYSDTNDITGMSCTSVTSSDVDYLVYTKYLKPEADYNADVTDHNFL